MSINSNGIKSPGSIHEISKEDFPLIRKIYGEKILTDNYNHHHKIFVIDKYLLTMVNSGDNHYHVFDKNSQEYLGPVGVRGEGPNEWEIPQTTVGQFTKSGDEIHLWNFDFLRGNFNKINLTKTLSSNSAYPVLLDTERINMRDFPYFQLFKGNNGKIYANGWIYETNRVRLKSYNPNTKEVEKSGLFPRIKNSNHLPAEVMNSLYGGSFDKHPSKDVFVQAMFMFDRIDIFDENLNLIRSIVDGENWKDDFYDGNDINPSINFLRPRINGYNGLAVSENFIFALEAKQNEGTDDEIENESFIRIYNWEGEPLAYFEVEHDLSSIDIDEDEGILYATDYSHELVLRFDISNFINDWL
ncbi:BF3164 family lipoprotein [Algoriphagus hitonicola]|uniref:TolB-like 6-blade propeller-like n=1 Tax=Algoriphagus hitonicola TaxID=435880 RepID=A0A1I2STG5_9BACT|nr:BF3164 family lipoprotein [Algoriphagus hitonicola]SFG56020.1 TolB-like 6-blade propeller-like [Algoriphagus hitonicola]